MALPTFSVIIPVYNGAANDYPRYRVRARHRSYRRHRGHRRRRRIDRRDRRGCRGDGQPRDLFVSGERRRCRRPQRRSAPSQGRLARISRCGRLLLSAIGCAGTPSGSHATRRWISLTGDYDYRRPDGSLISRSMETHGRWTRNAAEGQWQARGDHECERNGSVRRESFRRYAYVERTAANIHCVWVDTPRAAPYART